MAKVKLGPMAGQVSGSIGATTFSHNRGGTYIRRRAIPVISTTVNALAAKARLTSASQAWGALTAAQRLAWTVWAQMNQVTDVLGDKITLTGHAAYVMLSTRMLQAALTPATTPPVVTAPAPLLTLSATWDVGTGDFALTFTATPVGATKSVWVAGAVTDSASQVYIMNRLRVVKISGANQATGLDVSAELAAIFGTLTVGRLVTLHASVFDRNTGLISPPLSVSGVVVST
jgi:hypothetical protein